MKDMGDVVSYLNDILGPHHDFTIIARNQYESNLQQKEKVKYTVAEQIVLYWLSTFIFDVSDRGSPLRWNDESLIVHVKVEVAAMDAADIEEWAVVDSDNINVDQITDEVEFILNHDLKRFQKLRKQVETDLAGDILETLFG